MVIFVQIDFIRIFCAKSHVFAIIYFRGKPLGARKIEEEGEDTSGLFSSSVYASVSVSVTVR